MKWYVVKMTFFCVVFMLNHSNAFECVDFVTTKNQVWNCCWLCEWDERACIEQKRYRACIGRDANWNCCILRYAYADKYVFRPTHIYFVCAEPAQNINWTHFGNFLSRINNIIRRRHVLLRRLLLCRFNIIHAYQRMHWSPGCEKPTKPHVWSHGIGVGMLLRGIPRPFDCFYYAFQKKNPFFTNEIWVFEKNHGACGT